MEKREVIAYAITHAPRGQKGGPYEAESGPPGEECDSLRDACRWPTSEPDARECAAMYLEDHLSWQGDARVIRIVRKARPSRLCDACGFLIEAESRRRAPSEASAVEVLRELVRVGTTLAGKTPLPKEDIRVSLECFADEVRDVRTALARARRVLAASGPDPMPVVRAAMRETEAWDAYLAAPATRSRAETEVLDNASRKRFAAVDAYRKAGGK